MRAQQLRLVFCVPTCLSQNLKFWSCLETRNDKKHFVAYRKAVFRISFLKMHLLFGTVALWAWVHGSCVRVTGVESLHRPRYYFCEFICSFSPHFCLQQEYSLKLNPNSKWRSQCRSCLILNFPIFGSCT